MKIVLYLTNLNIFQVFENLRYKVLKKKRQLIAEQNGTGGGEASQDMLTDLEERMFRCWGGSLIVQGDVSIVEAGKIFNTF